MRIILKISRLNFQITGPLKTFSIYTIKIKYSSVACLDSFVSNSNRKIPHEKELKKKEKKLKVLEKIDISSKRKELNKKCYTSSLSYA